MFVWVCVNLLSVYACRESFFFVFLLFLIYFSHAFCFVVFKFLVFVDFIRIYYISLLRSPIRSGYGSWSSPEKNGINLWLSSLKLCNDGRKRTCFGVNSDFYIRFTCHIVLILCGYLWLSNGCFYYRSALFLYKSLRFYDFLFFFIYSHRIVHGTFISCIFLCGLTFVWKGPYVHILSLSFIV